MNIRGKKILLTGATGGIGELLAGLLHEQGAKLVLSCFQQQALQQLNEKLGGVHTLACADIASYEGRKEIVDVCQESGGIDAVINLAGVLNFNLFENQSAQLIEKTLSINLVAPVLLSQALIPMLREREEAMILNVGSIFGSIGHPGFVAYCTSKAGMKCFSEALSRELADSSIHVSYIAPRATRTALNDARINDLNSALGNKSDSPEYVAGEILKLFKSKHLVSFLGWPEKLFVRVNALMPGLVRRSLVKNLRVIKHYATAGETL
ncbi:MAG: short chain dehydrogenase [SAR86 cluster bacterium]|uniref:Short chain dehydrogenase n=1 Tax=SAR86 cluster bacterium TaxID=2030880 RepID=A0A2A5AXU0_9GAMM|nr:MAG: short chain dehydrogenase [SAR86 cluster bacterium]